METVYTDRGGWFGDKANSTGASSCLSSITKYVIAAGLLVSAGTGAFADDLTRMQQERKNEPTITNRVRVYSVETQAERTSAEDMEQIRKVLAPAMSDLAKSFNVSRQTIYNWLRGEQPTPEHTARLKELAFVADIFAGAGVSVNGALLQRRVIKGKNLFEIVREGGSAREAGQLLLQIVQNETSQRQRLAARYGSRSVSQPSADSDIMADNDVV